MQKFVDNFDLMKIVSKMLKVLFLKAENIKGTEVLRIQLSFISSGFNASRSF